MKWEEESYSRKDENGNLVSFEEYEAQQRANAKGLARYITKSDAKLFAICGVGFMIDAYDLFIINLVTPIWTYEYWGGLTHHQHTYPLLLRGAVNAAANIGNVVGQIGFGFFGDVFGRKFVYGKELIIAIVGIILLISLPNHMPGPTHNKFWYLFGFRLLMGIGIGGDYPMSAAIVAERTSLRNRGRMLALIFSNQGLGNLLGSIVTIILLAIFSGSLSNGHYGPLDAVWRLQFGLIIIPCAITLYFRLTMPESRKFIQSGELSAMNDTSVNSSATTLALPQAAAVQDEKQLAALAVEEHISTVDARKSKWSAFGTYFSEWRHLKTLIGTASCWFLVDVAFYGINLNQSVLLMNIGFAKGRNEYHTLLITAYGNLIIAAAGYVPGYFFTVAFIEILGRKPIQIAGFIITALMFGIIAGAYTTIGTGGKFACFTIAQFFFNFGPNATTFIVPGEIFPSRVRGLAHGLSAAIGKLGAILSGILFNWLSARIGVPKVLWIFFACELLGAIMTWFFVPESKGVDADAVDYAETMEKLAARGQLPTGNNGYDGPSHDYALQNSGPAYNQSESSMKTDL